VDGSKGFFTPKLMSAELVVLINKDGQTKRFIERMQPFVGNFNQLVLIFLTTFNSFVLRHISTLNIDNNVDPNTVILGAQFSNGDHT
jgi:hypothetical protein